MLSAVLGHYDQAMAHPTEARRFRLRTVNDPVLGLEARRRSLGGEHKRRRGL